MVTVTVAFCCVPTVTLPNARLLGEAVNCAAPAPLPETGSVALMDVVCGLADPEAAFILSEALPFKVTVPLTAPVAFGANATVKFAVCPGVMVAGRDSPLMVNAELLAESCEITTFVLPELVKVAFLLALCPTATLPNEREAGLRFSFPAATPLPETVTSTSLAVARSLLIAIFPAGLPAD